MSHHEEDLLKELNALKINHSLDTEKKETMKMALREHARKKQQHEQRKSKTKKSFIWLSTAAVVLLCGVFVYYLINNNQLSMPIADQDNNAESNEMAISDEEEKNQAGNDSREVEQNQDQADTDVEESAEESTTTFSIQENGEETQTIMIEGMEEEVNVHQYTMEPYGIKFQMEEFLSNYTTEDGEVRYYSEAENAVVRLRVSESTTIEQVLPSVQKEYNQDFSYTEEPSELPTDENPYKGMKQHFSEPPQGFYLYQVDDNVLIIQYEYIIEAADGMGPRLENLRKSIQ